MDHGRIERHARLLLAMASGNDDSGLVCIGDLATSRLGPDSIRACFHTLYVDSLPGEDGGWTILLSPILFGREQRYALALGLAWITLADEGLETAERREAAHAIARAIMLPYIAFSESVRSGSKDAPALADRFGVPVRVIHARMADAWAPAAPAESGFFRTFAAPANDVAEAV